MLLIKITLKVFLLMLAIWYLWFYLNLLKDIKSNKFNVLNSRKKHNIEICYDEEYALDFKEIEKNSKLNFDQLISTVCMISPFSVQEKQKLIEIVKTEDKIKILEEIIDFNLFDNQENKTIQ